jgi:hypothetical protein
MTHRANGACFRPDDRDKEEGIVSEWTVLVCLQNVLSVRYSHAALWHTKVPHNASCLLL